VDIIGVNMHEIYESRTAQGASVQTADRRAARAQSWKNFDS